MPDKLTLDRWNELIADVNELLNECGESQISDIEGPTKWYKGLQPGKASVQQLQDKLELVCDQNEFDEIPDKWKQSIIDELEDAIADGACCCEDDIIIQATSPNVIASVGYTETLPGGIPHGNGYNYQIWDWAGFILNPRENQSESTIECEDESTRTLYSGGYGDARELSNYSIQGTGFPGTGTTFGGQKTWQAVEFALNDGGEGAIISSGTIQDDYINLPAAGVIWQARQTCDSTPGGGMEPGSKPGGWQSPWTVDFNVADQLWTFTDANGGEFGPFTAQEIVTGGPNVVFTSIGSPPLLAVLQSSTMWNNGSLQQFTPRDPLRMHLKFFC